MLHFSLVNSTSFSLTLFLPNDCIYYIQQNSIYSQWSLLLTSCPWILCAFAKLKCFPLSKKLPRIVKAAHPVFSIVDWHAVVSLAPEAWGLASMVEPGRGTGSRSPTWFSPQSPQGIQASPPRQGHSTKRGGIHHTHVWNPAQVHAYRNKHSTT